MSIPLRLLLVEDSPDDAELLVRELQRGGYDVAFQRVDSAEAMSTALTGQKWDLVIADFSMPHFSGTAALRLVRERDSDLPFIFVSGTIGEDTAVAAMKDGAHDYIMKGNMRRLIPAIERELRDAETRRERRRVTDALKRSEAQYRELVENATYGIYRSTSEGRFLDVNPSLVKMLGYGSKEEVLALNIASDVWWNPLERSEVAAQYQYADRFEGVEVEWKRKDGKPIKIRLSGRTLRAADGGLPSFEVIAEDVTERRLLEKQVAGLQKFEAIGQLAGGIAHDFNNIIGAIMGWAEMGAKEVPPDTRPHKRFEQISEHARGAADLTRQLLAFARRQVMEPRNINLNQVISEATILLQKLVGAQIEIKTALEAGLKVTCADPTQIGQVLMNLVVNARDAMPEGGWLMIETRNVEFDEEYCRRHTYARPGQYVLLSVSDAGLGMDAATMDHIFEPFFTTKEVGRGTGLGLATVYGIVKQHQGFINVYSEPGHGTTFSVYLPVAAGVVAARENVTKKEEIQGGRETILVAEDHAGLREMAREMLGAFGYEVITAADGEEAVRLFRENRDRVALVLLDSVMPKLNGAQAYARISKLKAQVPVVFTTGYSSEALLLSGEAQQDTAILQKPYSSRTLAQKIRQLLDRQQ